MVERVSSEIESLDETAVPKEIKVGKGGSRVTEVEISMGRDPLNPRATHAMLGKVIGKNRIPQS
jgi:hypothetical protein